MTSSSHIWSLYGRGLSYSYYTTAATVSTSFFSTSSSLFSSSSASSQRIEQRNLTEGRAERDATLRRCHELMEKSSQTLAPLITDTAPWIVSRIGLGTQRLHPKSSDHQKTA
jgi:hypothetical protein